MRKTSFKLLSASLAVAMTMSNIGTLFFALGFSLMMILDVALG